MTALANLVTPANRTTLQNAAGATGNGTALAVLGYPLAAVQITGTFVATVTFEITTDQSETQTDNTWVAVEAIDAATGAKATTATTPGIYLVPCAGAYFVRARISAYTSGTLTAKGRAAAVTSGMPTTDIDVSLATGDVQIGAVEVKNAVDDTRAVVAAGTAVTEAGNTLAVKDPSVGVTTGAAVTTDAVGTVQQYLRGLIKILATIWDSTNNWLKVALQTTAMTVHATGSTAAPAANTVIADTGTLAAGKYDFISSAGGDAAAAAGKLLLIERRNAANTATLHRHLIPMPGFAQPIWRGITIATDERVRVITGATAFEASTTATGDIQARISQ